MNDNTQARPFPMNDPLPTATSDGPPLAELPHMLPLRFTGSGSEYFRIWIVNLLLTAVTLGLYYPYAKLRRLRYFFSNTEVGGYPLSFHADGRRMFLGYVLVAVLFGAYSLAGRFSQTAGLVAYVGLAVVWPLLWHSALRFRMANTGWRGLRLGFVGTRGDAYRALLPGFAAGLVFLAFALWADSRDKPPAAGSGLGAAQTGVLLMLGLFMLLMPYVLWLMRRYQHNHYVVAAERSQFSVTAGAFYGVSLRTVAVTLLALLPMLAVVFGVGVLLALVGVHTSSPDDRNKATTMMFYGFIGLLALTVLFQMLVWPYLTSRMQNLVWNGTRSQHLSFESHLRLRPLMWLTVKNWLLMIVTLGLYFPFAKVATARLRLEAVSVVSHVDPDTLMALPRSANDAALGEAAGDVFGIDIGL
jgi:uncharacterized membrane protein YjgN (DUF898 family)